MSRSDAMTVQFILSEFDRLLKQGTEPHWRRLLTRDVAKALKSHPGVTVRHDLDAGAVSSQWVYDIDVTDPMAFYEARQAAKAEARQAKAKSAPAAGLFGGAE